MNATHPIFFAETADETAHFLHLGVDPDITTKLGKTPIVFCPYSGAGFAVDFC